MKRLGSIQAVAIGGVVVMAGFLASRYALSRQSSSRVAREVLAASLSGNVEMVMKRLDPMEVRSLGLTSVKLKALLSYYVQAEFQACQPEGDVKVDDHDQAQGFSSAAQLYTTPQGTRAGLGCLAVLTPEGVICEGFVSNAIIGTMIAKYSIPGDKNKHAILARAISKDRQVLMDLGFAGLWDKANGFRAWDQVMLSEQERAADFERRTRLLGNGPIRQ